MVPFELAARSTPKVGPDCHVKVGRTLYSVPWRHIGARVDARESNRTVEVFVGALLVKTHPRAEKGRRTDYGDYPPEKVAFFMRTPTWCRRRSVELGTNVADVIDTLLAGGALHHLRSAQGILALADKHTAVRVDAACARAITVGDATYRTIKGILVAGTERDGDTTVRPPSAPAHLHGPLTLFSDLTDGNDDTGDADGLGVAG